MFRVHECRSVGTLPKQTNTWRIRSGPAQGESHNLYAGPRASPDTSDPSSDPSPPHQLLLKSSLNPPGLHVHVDVIYLKLTGIACPCGILKILAKLYKGGSILCCSPSFLKRLLLELCT